MNDILKPYRHKNIGWFCCVANAEKASTEDPQEGNIEEFELYWGDGFE